MNSLKFLAFPLGLAVAAATSTACSVYKSQGRKNFEGRAPDSIRAQTQSLSQTQSQGEDLCWNQPSDEPLWEINQDQELRVSKINEEQIQVCTSQENHP